MEKARLVTSIPMYPMKDKVNVSHNLISKSIKTWLSLIQLTWLNALSRGFGGIGSGRCRGFRWFVSLFKHSDKTSGEFSNNNMLLSLPLSATWDWARGRIYITLRCRRCCILHESLFVLRQISPWPGGGKQPEKNVWHSLLWVQCSSQHISSLCLTAEEWMTMNASPSRRSAKGGVI